MFIQKRTTLSNKEKAEVLDLLQACHDYDGTASIPYLANDYNVDQDMPCLLLAYEKEQLVGCLYIYADELDDVSVSLFVLPFIRKQGIARALEEELAQIVKAYHLSGISYETERMFMEKNPWLLDAFHLVEEEDSELWLRRARKPYELASRDNCEVSLADRDDIEEIAKLQTAAFENDFEYSLQYALTSFEGEGTSLYVLKKSGHVIASVTIDQTSDYNHIFGLAVAPNHQGQGFGKYLMKSAINQLLTQNERDFQIVVEKENIHAANLYRSLGFRDVTEVVYLKKG
ncbi:GNAT family N-acetyltransferase [Streptococcus pneumoniae]